MKYCRHDRHSRLIGPFFVVLVILNVAVVATAPVVGAMLYSLGLGQFDLYRK